MDSRPDIRLALVLGIALLVRWMFFHGFLPSDPYDYGAAAAAFAFGDEATFNGVASARFGLVVPVALFYWLFGVGEISSALWPVLCSLGTVVVGYLCGRYLGGERAGLIAAVLLALFPLDVIYGTQLMADVPLGFWLFTSLYLFLRGRDTENDGNRSLLFLGSGASIGLAYATKSVALVIAPFFAIYAGIRWARDKKLPWSLLYIVAGLAGVALVEMLFFFLVTGDPFNRYNVLSSAVGSRTQVVVSGAEATALSLLEYPKWMFVDIRYTGPIFVILAMIGVAALLRPSMRSRFREARLGLVALWSIVMFLVLDFYPLSINPYVPVYKLNNYMLMFTAPMIVCTALLINRLPRAAQNFCIAIVALAMPFSLYLSLESHRAHSDNARRVHEFAGNHPDARFIAEKYGIMTFDFLDGFASSNRYQDFTVSGPAVAPHEALEPGDIRDAYVVIDSYFVDYYSGRGFVYPDFVNDPPADWEIAFRYERAENPVRRLGIDVSRRLHESGWLPDGLHPRISAKLRSWSHTKPVTVYYVR